jgi:hypothetical protein
MKFADVLSLSLSDIAAPSPFRFHQLLALETRHSDHRVRQSLARTSTASLCTVSPG